MLAARAGKSLQEYLRGMLVETASRPSAADVIARARARVDATGARVGAEAILVDQRVATTPGLRCAVRTPRPITGAPQ